MYNLGKWFTSNFFVNHLPKEKRVPHCPHPLLLSLKQHSPLPLCLSHSKPTPWSLSLTENHQPASSLSRTASPPTPAVISLAQHSPTTTCPPPLLRSLTEPAPSSFQHKSKRSPLALTYRHRCGALPQRSL